MTEPKAPRGVKRETVSWHLADGTPTDDKAKAVSAEVTTEYDDGRVEHRLMRKAGS